MRGQLADRDHHLSQQLVASNATVETLPKRNISRSPIEKISNLVQPGHSRPTGQNVVENVYDLNQECILVGQRRKNQTLPALNYCVVHRKSGVGQRHGMGLAIPEGKTQFDRMRSLRLILPISRRRYRYGWHQVYKFVCGALFQGVSSA